MQWTRREWVGLTAAGTLAAQRDWRHRVAQYLETLALPDGGYGWAGDADSHLTPTFFTLATYHSLGLEPPRKPAVAAYVRAHHPLPLRRHTDRPLRRFWFEQMQALEWLGEDASDFRPLVQTWTGPSEFTTRYEFGGNPVFQQETFALRSRRLLGLGPTPEWRQYVLTRRRPDGSFNNTPAADGSGGHILNSMWGYEALIALGERERPPVEWVQSCQLSNGGFTWAPQAPLAAVDDVAYTWAGVRLLAAAGAAPRDRDACVQYLRSLWNHDGGFGDRPGRRSNPMATWYAVDALLAIESAPEQPRAPIAAKSLPSGLQVFTAQVEAPGQGSPADAVEMARTLGIHLWCAKNSPEGWIARAQKIADDRGVRVLFAVGNEEYGTYVDVPGLGAYSHLVDVVAPPGVPFGEPLANPKKPWPWTQFRDTRIAALRRAGGRNTWQFNENEELTRILLDEAVETGTFAAIATYHFGNENFQHTQPFLMRYHGVLPMIALQDAHAKESWWWGDQLEGFRTVFLARRPDWEGWLEALRENRVMAICADARTNFETRFAGGSEPVRRVVSEWWDQARPLLRRPSAIAAVVRAGDPFEVSAPEAGAVLRIRMRRRNTTQGVPAEPLNELIRVTIDGREIPAELRETDPHYVVSLAGMAPGHHRAKLFLRDLATRAESSLTMEFVL